MLGLVPPLNAEDTEAGKDAQIIALMAITIDEQFECNVRGGCGHRWSTVKVLENLVCDALRLNTALHLDLEEAIVPELEEVNGWDCPAWSRVLMITHERSMYDFEDVCAWAKEIHVTGRDGENFRYVLRVTCAGPAMTMTGTTSRSSGRRTDCWFMVIGALRTSCPRPSCPRLGRGQTSVQIRVT
jgi:hypothetical protein